MPLDDGIVNSLPEEIRKEPSFAEFQKGDLASVFKTAIDGQKTIGRSIILPDEKDPEEKRAEKLNSIYEKMGRPKTHAEYDKDLFPENRLTEQQIEKYTKVFHEAGLNNAQAKKLIGAYFEDLSGSPLTAEGAIEAITKGDEGKNNGWGENTEKNIGIARAGLAKFGDEELAAFLEESGLGNHPVFLRHFYKLGTQIKEDTTPGTTSRHSGQPDKAAAQSRLAEIVSDKAYLNSAAPNHRALVEEATKLHQIISGVSVVAELGLH